MIAYAGGKYASNISSNSTSASGIIILNCESTVMIRLNYTSFLSMFFFSLYKMYARMSLIVATLSPCRYED